MRASQRRYLASSPTDHTKRGEPCPNPLRRVATTRRIAALLLIGLLVAAACSSKKSGSRRALGRCEQLRHHEAGQGGSVVYAQEAEDAGGLCLPEAQLDISGINYARTIYDTLTMPNDKGEFVPYLAKSVDHNADYTVWTIGLRDGIKFHDGTALDAQVVKNNLDAYRGAYPARHPILFSLVFGPYIKSVDVVDPMTVQRDRRPAVARLPVVPVVEQPARHHGAGPARQHRLREGPHRHRPVQAA